MADDRIKIIDIRDGLSYDNGHIEHAIQLNSSNADNFINNTPIDTPIIIYCYHGNSSQSAGQFLAEQGFKEVYSLDGGYELWKTLGTEGH
jgi:thiosulfate sulfurtransferase